MASPNTEDEPDVAQMWFDIQTEFQKVSGRPFDPSHVLSVDDVMARANPKKDRSAKSSAKIQKAKDVLSKTLYCIQTFGSMAAQAASMVFGPSNMCFNAVTYLCDTATNYMKIFDGLADLFERISAFFDRFDVYVRSKAHGLQIDNHLKRIIHELLRSFMRICIKSLKIAKEPKVFLALEVFSFGTDKGVRDELCKLETLVARESSMSIALILESVSKEAQDITAGFAETKQALRGIDDKQDQLLGYQKRQENAEQRKEVDDTVKKNRDVIRKALEIKDKEPWRDTQKELVRTQVPDTGDWLLQHADYKAWTDFSNSSPNVLALRANEGFGKSHICSAALQHLARIYPAGHEDPRVSVAYYYFGQETKDQASVSKTAKSTDDTSVNKAIKAVLWQLAQADSVYSKAIAGVCDREVDFVKNKELWRVLVSNITSSIDSVFFIVLDGVDEAESEQTRDLAEIVSKVHSGNLTAGQLRIRMLLTGRPKALDLVSNGGQIEFPSIELGILNQSDIYSYIDSRMDDMEILRRSNHPDIRELRSRIRDRLAEGVKGDYIKLDYKLTEISSKRRKNEIEAILERAAEDREEAITRVVKKLNDSLGEEDIEELNEILLWVIGAKEQMTVEHLDAALRVKTKDTSLVSLDEQIEEKYNGLLEISRSDKVVTLVSDNMEEYLRGSSDSTEDLRDSRDTLHKSEVTIVRKFLNMVCDEDLYARFGFDQFFKRKLGNTAAKIQYISEKADLSIIKSCLALVCDDQPTSDMTALSDYAYFWLPDHLNAVDLSLADPQSKAEIGRLLVDLFSDSECINQWWSESRVWMRQWWVFDDEYCGWVLDWFKDSAVSKGLQDKDKLEWVANLTSNSAPDDDLLRYIAETMAARWVQSDEWSVTDTYQWLLGYITKIRHRRDKSDRVVEDVEDASVEQIQLVEDWSRNTLRIDQPDSLWHIQLAITLRNAGHYEEALNRYHQALDLDENNWRALYGISRTMALKGDFQPAIDRLVELMGKFKDIVVSKEESVYFDDMPDFLGLWNAELKQYDAAIEAYRSIIEHYHDRYRPAFMIISLLSEQKKYAEAVAFLQELGSKVDPQGISRLITLYHEYSDDSGYHELITLAAQKSGNLRVIKDAYQKAVEAARLDDSKLSVLVSLRYWYGIALFHHREAEPERDQALRVWEENMEMSAALRSDWTVEQTKKETAKQLAISYLQMAKEAKVNSQIANKHLQKLAALSSTGDDDGGASNIDTKLLLARLHHLRGDESQAKEVIRGRMKTALDLLSDEDPSNDYQGFYLLASIFMAVDDDVNAIACWCLCGPDPKPIQGTEDDDQEQTQVVDQSDADVTPSERPSEASPEVPVLLEPMDDREVEPGAQKDRNEKEAGVSKLASVTEMTTLEIKDSDEKTTNDDFPVANKDQDPESIPAQSTLHGYSSWHCDGFCGVKWEWFDHIYCCKDCLDIQFEPNCYAKLQDGTLDRKVCGKIHDILEVPAFDEAQWRSIPTRKMRVGGELVVIDDWLNGIRRKWGFAEVESGQVERGGASDEGARQPLGAKQSSI